MPAPFPSRAENRLGAGRDPGREARRRRVREAGGVV